MVHHFNNMRDSDLKSLGVSRDEVKTALAHESRRGVRRRLVAIDSILAGKSIKQASRAAKATPRTVDRWLEQVRRSGFESLLVDRRRGHARFRMDANEMRPTRREIAAALARPLKPQARARLIAIDAVLSGQPIEEAAATARVLANTVRSWLRLVARDAIRPALARWEGLGEPRPRLLDADPGALRELAAREKNPRVRKRMLALAFVAEGMSPHAASFAARLNYSAVLKRIRRFRDEGAGAFYDTAPSGRRQKLTQDQLQELRAEMLQQRDLGYRQLSEFIAARFGVRYSSEGLRLLLKREFGFVWKNGGFTEGPKGDGVLNRQTPWATSQSG